MTASNILSITVTLIVLTGANNPFLPEFINQCKSNLSIADLEESLEVGHQFVRTLNLIDSKISPVVARDILLSGMEPPPFWQEEQSRKAAVQLAARQFIRRKYGIPPNKVNFDILNEPVYTKIPPPKCDFTYKYRSLDGTCNNLEHPRYGQSETIYQRLMGPATYSDGVSVVRLAQSGAALPSPRLISTTIAHNESEPENRASLLTMQWGQFLDHDIALTPSVKAVPHGTIILCCSPDNCGSQRFCKNPHPECIPITVPNNDPVYHGKQCLGLVRSSYGLNLDGSTPFAREQINENTHWIDGSQIYGSNYLVAETLRDPSLGKGLMKVSFQDGRMLLPLSNSCCPDETNNSCPAAKGCFITGDPRMNDQPFLAVMHTLWIREHNRIANKLYSLYGTNKSDEFYYQETRRIVIAELQHITYHEYLPLLLGPLANFPSLGNRAPPNPAIFNEFNTAAFRMGHSQLRSFFRLHEADGTRSPQSFFLGDAFLSGASRLLNPTFIDNALRGLVQTPSQAVDDSFPDDITSKLFRLNLRDFFNDSKKVELLQHREKIGADLLAINIQRGRDHGLPPYVEARAIAQTNLNIASILPIPITFDELNSTTPQHVIAYFKKLYESVEDIDLYIGGVTEKHLPGALVGPTFGYIIAEQFENLKHADRFFYNDLTKSVSFTEDQLNEIKKTSIARILCDNSDGSIQKIQPKAFRPPSETNSPIPCDEIPSVNFENFKLV